MPTPSWPMRRPWGRTWGPGKAKERMGLAYSSTKCMSDPQTVAMVILMMASSGPGVGMGTSMISTLPFSGFTAAFIGDLRVGTLGVVRVYLSTGSGKGQWVGGTGVRAWGFKPAPTRGSGLGQGFQEVHHGLVDFVGAFLLGPVAGAFELEDLEVGDEVLHGVHGGEGHDAVAVSVDEEGGLGDLCVLELRELFPVDVHAAVAVERSAEAGLLEGGDIGVEVFSGEPRHFARLTGPVEELPVGGLVGE